MMLQFHFEVLLEDFVGSKSQFQEEMEEVTS